MDTRLLRDAENQGIEFAKSKGASSIAELRALPAMAIIARDTLDFRFGIVQDGYFQTENAGDAFTEGKQNDVPFMSGMNADETRYTGSMGDDFKALYPLKSDEDAAVKLAGQEQSRLNIWLWMEFRAKTSKTHAYEYFFDRAIPWPEHPEFGAFHTGEVPYVFNNIKMLRDHPMEKNRHLSWPTGCHPIGQILSRQAIPTDRIYPIGYPIRKTNMKSWSWAKIWE